MEQENNKQTEKLLEAFSLKPAPPSLKEKILVHARQKHKTNNVKIAYWWKGLAACCVLMIFVIVIDVAVTYVQNKRISSIYQKEQESIALSEEERSLIRDIIGEFSGSAESSTKSKLFLSLEKKNDKRRQPEWRISLEKEIE
jgi:hypothetical protein